jgi:hypothetical protein
MVRTGTPTVLIGVGMGIEEDVTGRLNQTRRNDPRSRRDGTLRDPLLALVRNVHHSCCDLANEIHDLLARNQILRGPTKIRGPRGARLTVLKRLPFGEV